LYELIDAYSGVPSDSRAGYYAGSFSPFVPQSPLSNATSGRRQAKGHNQAVGGRKGGKPQGLFLIGENAMTSRKGSALTTNNKNTPAIKISYPLGPKLPPKRSALMANNESPKPSPAEEESMLLQLQRQLLSHGNSPGQRPGLVAGLHDY